MESWEDVRAYLVRVACGVFKVPLEDAEDYAHDVILGAWKLGAGPEERNRYWFVGLKHRVGDRTRVWRERAFLTAVRDADFSVSDGSLEARQELREAQMAHPTAYRALALDAASGGLSKRMRCYYRKQLKEALCES